MKGSANPIPANNSDAPKIDVVSVDLGGTAILISLAIRLAAALITRTSFHPDEYYQSVEPAYQLVFGGAVTTWEWDPVFRIRSLIPLSLLSVMYYICKLLSLNNIPLVMDALPRLSQSLIAFIGDYFYIKIAKNISGKKADLFTILILFQFLSWSNLYCLSRTLINGTETTLFIFIMHEALRVYGDGLSDASAIKVKLLSDSNNFNKTIYYMISLISLAFYIRPTSALISLPFILAYFYSVFDVKIFDKFINSNFNIKSILKIFTIAAAPIFICIGFDSYLFGIFDGNSNKKISDFNIVFPLVSFIKFNYVENISAVFGVKSALWNFKEGLPTMLGLYTPLLCIFLLKLCIRSIFLESASASKFESLPPLIRSSLLASIAYPLFLAIFTSHFELRFLLVCLPGLHLFLGYYYYINYYSVRNIEKLAKSSSKKKGKGLNPLIMVLIFILNVILSSYMNLYHQSGPESAARFINSDISINDRSKNNHMNSNRLSLYLLAPCYSFTGKAHFNSNIDLHFPKCPIESKLIELSSNEKNNKKFKFARGLNKKKLIDESALFVSDPVKFTESLLDIGKDCDGSGKSSEASGTCNSTLASISRIPLIDIILTFDGYLTPSMNETLTRHGFKVKNQFHHAHFRYDYDDPVAKKKVILLSKV